MEINEKAQGNISQQAVTRNTDNETGHDPRRDEDDIPLPRMTRPRSRRTCRM